MRCPMIFAKCAASFLLLVLFMAGPQARAQNQTPANVAPVAPTAGWTDPATGLTWTKADNGSDVNWNQANDYCSNLRLGGYSGWRLPTIDELEGIYDPSQRIPLSNPGCGNFQSKIKREIALSSFIDYHNGNVLAGAVWSSSLSESQSRHPWFFPFADPVPERGHNNPYKPAYMRALCVRHSGE